MDKTTTELNPKLAEFVGILLGDGHISYPKQPRIKISFDSRDMQYIRYVKKLLIALLDVNVVERYSRSTNSCDLLFFKRAIIRMIIFELEVLPSPKWNRMRVPNWIIKNKLEKHFLRGLFDTDGCLTLTNNNGTVYPRIEIKVAPSPAQHQIIDMLSKIGFRFGIYMLPRGNVRIQLNGKNQLLQWMREIGFNNEKHFNKASKFY